MGTVWFALSQFWPMKTKHWTLVMKFHPRRLTQNQKWESHVRSWCSTIVLSNPHWSLQYIICNPIDILLKGVTSKSRCVNASNSHEHPIKNPLNRPSNLHSPTAGVDLDEMIPKTIQPWARRSPMSPMVLGFLVKQFMVSDPRPQVGDIMQRYMELS